MGSVRGEAKPAGNFSGSPSLASYRCRGSSSPNWLEVRGEPTSPTLSSPTRKLGWLGEQYVLLADKPNLAGIVGSSCRLGVLSPARAGVWKVLDKRQSNPLVYPRSGRAEVGTPLQAGVGWGTEHPRTKSPPALKRGQCRDKPR